MDKIKVNNQVVKMRKHVKRARLFAINKFTKQMKLLQSKKGNDSQAEKNERKVERLLEKIKILKKMVPDLVSKKALSKAQDWSTVLAQKNIPLEDQCLALLANDTQVQKEVENFHTAECELAAKIPSLLLEWEMKSKIPKFPDKKKKAFDIKKQKLDKIAKRRKSNFKGATFPNNVAVDKLKASNNKKRRVSGHAPDENSNVKHDKSLGETLVPFEDDSKERNKLKSESFNDSVDGESGEFFTKIAKSESENSEPIEDDSDENDQLDSSDDSRDSDSGEFFTKTAKSSKNQSKNSEPMEDDSIKNDHLDSESSDDSSNGEPEGFFTETAKSKKGLLLKEQIKSKPNGAQMAEKSQSIVNSSCEEEGNNKDDRKTSLSTKVESSENLAADPQLSIFERLNVLANTDTKNLKAKKIKSSSASQNTKAIKVLVLNELQDTDQILIQNIPADSQESNNAPQTVVPKKDSFFLNGDEEVQSSEDESNVNNFRDFKPKRKFSDRNEEGGKFRRSSFGDRSRKPSSSFKEKGFNKNENKFQDAKGKGFNQSEKRFQNRKRKDFNQNESRFQKNLKGNSQFNGRKKFDTKSKEGFRQVKHTNPAKMNDSSRFSRENKKNMMNDSFQSKKQSNEKEEKNIHLHPSWEAKKKLKDAAKSGFKGKRIVFE